MTGKNLILIGFMGAGKTSLGTRYARDHRLDFLDTDQMIEEREGMTVKELFKAKGEEAFRGRETQLLLELLDRNVSGVISVGGGLPVRKENRELLRKLGTVIYLRVSPDTVLERLKGDTTRPLLQGEDARKRVEELLAFRTPIYEETAHVVIDGDNRSFQEMVEALNQIAINEI